MYTMLLVATCARRTAARRVCRATPNLAPGPAGQADAAERPVYAADTDSQSVVVLVREAHV